MVAIQGLPPREHSLRKGVPLMESTRDIAAHREASGVSVLKAPSSRALPTFGNSSHYVRIVVTSREQKTLRVSTPAIT